MAVIRLVVATAPNMRTVPQLAKIKMAEKLISKTMLLRKVAMEALSNTLQFVRSLQDALRSDVTSSARDKGRIGRGLIIRLDTVFAHLGFRADAQGADVEILLNQVLLHGRTNPNR